MPLSKLLFDHVINGEPALLFHRGRALAKAMKRERVTEEEVLAAIRSAGLVNFDEVKSVVLETDGTFSVVWHKTSGTQSSLRDVKGHPTEQRADGEPGNKRRLIPTATI